MKKRPVEIGSTNETGLLSRRRFLGGALAGAAAATVPASLAGQGISPPRPPSEAVPEMDASKPSGSTRIGNLHAFMPGGVAFIQDDAIGIVLNIGPATRSKFMTAAPDFSYNRLTWQEGISTVVCEWGRVHSDSAACRLKSDSPVRVKLTLPRKTWFPFNNVYYSVRDGVDATAITPDGRFVSWKLRVAPVPVVNDNNTVPEAFVIVEVIPQKPVHISAGFGTLPELSSVDTFLDRAAANYAGTRASAVGEWGDFVAPIAENLNNSKLYSSVSRQVMHIVGRGDEWVADPDYPPIFCWDSFFNALLASLEDPRAARDTVRGAFLYQTPEGMVANVSGWSGPNTRSGTMSIGNSQPPVASLCIWKLHQRWPDRSFLTEIYPRLLKWHDWWPQHSDGNKNGLLEWGSSTGIFQEARFGTGWDDSPQWEGVRMIGTQMNVDAVDLNSLWSMDAEYLSLIAAEIGETRDARRLREEHNEINGRMNRELWNEDVGTYCHRFWDEDGTLGNFVTRLSPANFYPLICGAPDERRASRMVEILTDPNKFWGEWMVPTLPYDDPDWAKQEYWKGHIWAPVNYLLWQGVQRYCSPQQKAQFSRRSVKLFMRNWLKNGTCNENYKSTDGSGDDYPHYTWGALLCQIGIESLYSIDEKHRPVPTEAIDISEHLTLRNMPAGGKLFRIERLNARTVISLEDNRG